jgi:hypothetical protein
MSRVDYNRAGLLSNAPETRRVWYTGKTVATTKAGRSNITEDATSVSTRADSVVQVGSVLCRDPYGFDQGIGVDYTRPATGILHEHKVVVVALEPYASNDPATDGPGRWVLVQEMSAEINVLIKASGITTPTTGANGSLLGVVDGSFALVDLNYPTSGGTTITDNSGGTATATVPATVAQTVVQIPVQLSDFANSQAWTISLPYAHTVISAGFRTGKPASTISKAATLTLSTTAGAVTGGVISLTTANQNATGTLLASTAISGANLTNAAGGSIIFTASSVTAFVEGDGWIEVVVRNNDLANTIASLIAAANGAKALQLRACAVPVDPTLSSTDLSGNSAAARRCRFNPAGVTKTLP